MELLLATIGTRRAAKHSAAAELLAFYRERIRHYCPCDTAVYATEDKLLSAADNHPARKRDESAARPNPQLVLLDSRGRALPTEQFAQWLNRQRENAVPRLIFAVGPANGWSDDARRRAGLLLSLGPMTLAHELAAVVLAEQLYRAFTIIEGHPYHLGHMD